LWLEVKCLSNSEIAGIPRKALKCKVVIGCQVAPKSLLRVEESKFIYEIWIIINLNNWQAISDKI